MRVEFLGGASEVGKSGIRISERDINIVLDYGVDIQTNPPRYPLPVKNVTAAVLSHSHLDHCGSMPALYTNEKPRTFMTDVTLESSLLLIKDSIKIARRNGYLLPFGKNEVKRMIKQTKLVTYEEHFKIGNISCQLFDSGHVPGSSGVLLSGGKKIFYTGDIKLEPTRLLNGCKLPQNIDTLIMESTYSQKDHPDRLSEEKRLISAIEEALAMNETALIPVFAVGRAQEILLILENYSDKIALDGMAKAASEIILEHKYYLKDPEKLKKVLKKIKWIRSDKEREKAVKKYPIIVTTAAMMSGGPVLYYLRMLKSRKGAKVLFVGYLVEDSPARNLIETGIFTTAEESYSVHCDLRQYDLSSHAGRKELFQIINLTKPKQVICIHGDECEKFARDIEERFSNIQAIAPKNGDALEI